MWPNPQETADLVTFTEEILNGKLHFLCSGYSSSTGSPLQKISAVFLEKSVLEDMGDLYGLF